MQFNKVQLFALKVLITLLLNHAMIQEDFMPDDTYSCVTADQDNNASQCFFI